VQLPSSQRLFHQSRAGEVMAASGGQLPGANRGKHVGHVAAGRIPFETRMISIRRDQAAGVGEESTVVEKTDEASSINLERVVTNKNRGAACQPLLQLCFKAVVVGFAGVFR